MSPSGVVLDLDDQLPELEATSDDIERMLGIIDQEIFPITEQGVAKGNKMFGAAILDSDLKTKVVETNSELTSPLFHGEVHAIYQWSKVVPAGERGPSARSGVFLSTHEPCCMCISSIVWTGFQRVYYLFPYEATKAQGIPYDINIMHELWGVESYRKQSKFCSTACLIDLVESLPDSDVKKEGLRVKIEELTKKYEQVSNKYHSEKSENTENSLAFG